MNFQKELELLKLVNKIIEELLDINFQLIKIKIKQQRIIQNLDNID